MKGKHLAIGVAILALAVALLMGVRSGNGADPTDKAIPLVLAQQPTTDQVIEAYQAGDAAKMQEYYRAFGGNADWGSYAKFEARVKQVIKHRAEAAKRKAREDALGTWQNAVENGKVVKEDGDIKFYDVNDDGIADFQIAFAAGRPDAWRFCDESGEPYG